MKIINIDTLSNVIKDFISYKKCIIFGKGPTFQILDKKDYIDTAFICVNETINYIDNCDLLVCNDIESIEKIDKKKLHNCKNILIPYYIHKNSRSHKNIDYKNVIQLIEKDFTNNLIIYNLVTGCKKHKEFPSLQTAQTSSHTAFEFIAIFIKNITKVDFYGFATDGDNTKAIFYNSINNIHNNSHRSRYNLYRNVIKNISIKYNIIPTLF